MSKRTSLTRCFSIKRNDKKALDILCPQSFIALFTFHLWIDVGLYTVAVNNLSRIVNNFRMGL